MPRLARYATQCVDMQRISLSLPCFAAPLDVVGHHRCGTPCVVVVHANRAFRTPPLLASPDPLTHPHPPPDLSESARFAARPSFTRPDGVSNLAIAKAIASAGPVAALVPNAATLTVEEGLLVYTWVSARATKTRCRAVLSSRDTRVEERLRAHDELVEAEDVLTVGLLEPGLVLAVRAGCSVVGEAVGAAFGTVLLPGVGTYLGQTVGNLVCWMAGAK